MKGKGMTPEIVLFGMAILVLIGAAFLYFSKENNYYINMTEATSATKHEVEELRKELKAYSEHQDAIGPEIFDQKKRVADLEARLQKFVEIVPQISVVFPKGLGVRIHRQDKPVLPRPPEGISKTPLLDKVGISK